MDNKIDLLGNPEHTKTYCDCCNRQHRCKEGPYYCRYWCETIKMAWVQDRCNTTGCSIDEACRQWDRMEMPKEVKEMLIAREVFNGIDYDVVQKIMKENPWEDSITGEEIK